MPEMLSLQRDLFSVFGEGSEPIAAVLSNHPRYAMPIVEAHRNNLPLEDSFESLLDSLNAVRTTALRIKNGEKLTARERKKYSVGIYTIQEAIGDQNPADSVTAMIKDLLRELEVSDSDLNNLKRKLHRR